MVFCGCALRCAGGRRWGRGAAHLFDFGRFGLCVCFILMGVFMTAVSRNVLRDVPSLSEGRFRELFAADVARACAEHGKAQLADAIGRCPRSMDNMIAQGMAKADAVFAMLAADPSSFDHLCRHFGIQVSVREAAGPDAMGQAAAEMCRASANIIQALSDGRIDHLEAPVIAESFRQLVPAMQGFLERHDALRLPRAVA